jgi:beta-lactam-binding protein with PASTA domain
MGDHEKVLVPAFVGLEVAEAHALAFTARVALVTADPAEPLPVTGVVTAQAPSAGTRVDPAASVAVAVDPDHGGGGGGGSTVEPPPQPLDPAGTKPGP